MKRMVTEQTTFATAWAEGWIKDAEQTTAQDREVVSVELPEDGTVRVELAADASGEVIERVLPAGYPVTIRRQAFYCDHCDGEVTGWHRWLNPQVARQTEEDEPGARHYCSERCAVNDGG